MADWKSWLLQSLSLCFKTVGCICVAVGIRVAAGFLTSLSFPLSAGTEEEQSGENGRKPREILVSVGRDSFSWHCPVLGAFPV